MNMRSETIDTALIDIFVDKVRCYKVPVMPVGYKDTYLGNNLISAIRRTPRHLFTENFTVGANKDLIYNCDHEDFMQQIYSAQSLIYNLDGTTIPSSNSEPRFILHLLDVLDVRVGERVLEVGSGAGWLTALVSRLVGPSGMVTGIEVIDQLATAARRNLAHLNIDNVDIIEGNILDMEEIGGPYDKIIFTASTFSLPAPVFESLNIGGVVGVPIRNIGNSEEFYFLRKANDHVACSFASRGARFVPIVGGDDGDYTGVSRPNDAVRSLMETDAVYRHEMDFGRKAPQELLNWTMGYTRRMSKMNGPRFTAWDLDDEAPLSSLHALSQRPRKLAFGMAGSDGSSLAVWRDNEVWGYGDKTRAIRDARFMLDVFNSWVEDGRPFGFQWGLEMRKSEHGSTPPEKWVERRGSFDLVWKQ